MSDTVSLKNLEQGNVFKKVYSIYDKAVKRFNMPFLVTHEAEAIRAFETNVNADDTNPISRNPSDYALYYLGIFKDKEGRYEQEDNTLVIEAVQLKEVKKRFTIEELAQQLKPYINE